MTEYRVEREEPNEPDSDAVSYVVRDGSDRAVCSVTQEQQALHYSVLLEEAFRRGVRQGYGLAKRGEPRPD